MDNFIPISIIGVARIMLHQAEMRGRSIPGLRQLFRRRREPERDQEWARKIEGKPSSLSIGQ